MTFGPGGPKIAHFPHTALRREVSGIQFPNDRQPAARPSDGGRQQLRFASFRPGNGG